MLTGEVSLSCPNVTFEHSVLRFKGKLSNTFTTDHTGVYCVMISESSAMIVASLPHVNVYLFFPHTLSLSLSLSLSIPPFSFPLFSLGCFLAGAWDYCADQDLSSGWVNISFFVMCVCVCEYDVMMVGVDLKWSYLCRFSTNNSRSTQLL